MGLGNFAFSTSACPHNNGHALHKFVERPYCNTICEYVRFVFGKYDLNKAILAALTRLQCVSLHSAILSTSFDFFALHTNKRYLTCSKFAATDAGSNVQLPEV